MSMNFNVDNSKLDLNQADKFNCCYNQVYQPIYDTDYNVAFVFLDEDELEDEGYDSINSVIDNYPSMPTFSKASKKRSTSSHRRQSANRHQ